MIPEFGAGAKYRRRKCRKLRFHCIHPVDNMDLIMPVIDAHPCCQPKCPGLPAPFSESPRGAELPYFFACFACFCVLQTKKAMFSGRERRGEQHECPISPMGGPPLPTVPARVLLKDPLFLPGRFRPVSFANGGLAAVAILPVLAAEVLCLGA